MRHPGTELVSAPGRTPARTGAEKAVITIEVFASASALAGGLLLMLAPDGSC